MNNNTSIILIGFMGSGKSSVGNDLAKKLNKNHIDTDLLIEKHAHKSISECFSISEEYFRKQEQVICQSLHLYQNTVISTGGGIISSKQSRDYLSSIGLIIYLSVNANTILKRLEKDNTRPLLNNPDKDNHIKSLLTKRQPLYQEIADYFLKSIKYLNI